MKKKQSKKWFVRVRGSYLPNSWQGWLTYIPFTAFLVAICIFNYSTDHSKVVASITTILDWGLATTTMTYIASKKS